MTPHEQMVAAYIHNHFRVVFWEADGAQKGPTEKGWTTKPYTLADYHEGMRVGILLGAEVAPGQFLHDVDIDWAPGYKIALAFLPKTDFTYGRKSKTVSHCFYTLPEALPRIEFKDPVDKTMLLEIRGAKDNGELGHQSMVPPSVWSDASNNREPLEFRTSGMPSYVEVTIFRQKVAMGAIGMLLAKHFGHNGFGHEARLAWAGYLLRASLSVDELVTMGEAISYYCNNREVVDVRRVVESTAAALAREDKKVKGGPALAKVIGGDAGRKIVETINSWLGRDSNFIRNADGVIIKDNQENIRRAVRMLGYELSYQEFAERKCFRRVDNTDETWLTIEDSLPEDLWLAIDREHRFRPSIDFFRIVFSSLFRENRFHPVRDYLRGLVWDKVKRIDTWLKTYGGAVEPPDDPGDSSVAPTYLEAVSSIVLIAAVRRVMDPGCKYDEMLVLESKQGLNKSSALRALCPYDDWFSDDLPLNCDAKEIIERTLGKWIIEASDLVGGRKADRDHLKSMLSRQVDGPARMAYAHSPVERPRQFIIVGTTNSSEYLADITGARRFWPVKVGRFDVEGIVRDRNQLWAEAVERERAGESIRLTESLWGAAGEHQEQRREIDAWEDTLRFIVDGLEVNVTGHQQVTAETLWMGLTIPIDRRDRFAAKRLSEIMQRLGFKRKSMRDGGRVVTGYVRDGDDVKVSVTTKKDDEDLPF